MKERGSNKEMDGRQEGCGVWAGESTVGESQGSMATPGHRPDTQDGPVSQTRAQGKAVSP